MKKPHFTQKARNNAPPICANQSVILGKRYFGVCAQFGWRKTGEAQSGVIAIRGFSVLFYFGFS